ncbi:L-asparaginase ii [Colletotrichum tofieldiae]|nr:L-asparaginase ii [Colletotrichum tofieldiae]GKT68655.1 L-asparaginase ii [Colletotrichum tofieldiae]
MSNDDFVFSERGGVIENTHRIHAAITDASGNLLFAVGNPSRLTLARSAAKPAQILALLEVNGFAQIGFDDAEIALMCSSHSSEERHVARGRAMLHKIQATESDLQCGGHAALSDDVNKDWTKRDFTPGALCNNCSAKHIGMLAAARVLSNDNAADYHLSNHEIQIRVRRTFEEVSGLSPDEIKWCIDGCNLPTPGLPLRNISLLYAALADAADVVAREDGMASPRTRHLAHIYNSMWRFPEMVGGESRFCTRLMLSFQGAVVGKVGADGCYGVAIRESADTKRHGALGGLGLAIKVEDGNTEILYAAVMEILCRLGIGASDARRELDLFHNLQLANTAGVVTGKIGFPFKLRSC